ncbi:MAG: complex I NDUFA9 subunit family protein [Pseudomonadota bacterium]|nr:complex I NDUFA9 subunit family protein [Pseudomonadota bacterium]
MSTICLLGGSGFVGQHLAQWLTKQGWQIRILTRRREQHRELLVLPTLKLISADITDQAQLNTHLAGCDVVVNLIGILNEKGDDGAGFRRLHVDLPQKIINACQHNKINRLLHMSALNADAQSGQSHYLRTKGEGEDLVHAAEGINVTSFRPSVIFGQGDSFFNQFKTLLKISPYFFMLPSAHAKFAPVWVNDVVAAMATTIEDPTSYGQRYNLCGPHVYRLEELVAYTADVNNLRRRIIPLNDSWSYRAAWFMERIPGKPYSLDNYRSSQKASTCHQNHLPELGITPHSVEAILPKYMGPFASRMTRLSEYRHNARRV